MKSVSNPLTIIALFAALAEVAGTVAIKLVAADMQSTFIWFVMIFPTIIVVLFFITLNFNAKVLYAPGDFKNEENYLAAMNAKQSLGIGKVQTMMAEARIEIISEMMKTISTNGAGERNKVEKFVTDKLQPVQDAVEDVRSEIYNDYLRTSFLPKLSDNVRKRAISRVKETLEHAGKPLTAAEIAKEGRINADLAMSVLLFLVDEGVMMQFGSGCGAAKFVFTKQPSKAQ